MRILRSIFLAFLVLPALLLSGCSEKTPSNPHYVLQSFTEDWAGDISLQNDWYSDFPFHGLIKICRAGQCEYMIYGDATKESGRTTLREVSRGSDRMHHVKGETVQFITDL